MIYGESLMCVIYVLQQCNRQVIRNNRLEKFTTSELPQF